MSRFRQFFANLTSGNAGGTPETSGTTPAPHRVRIEFVGISQMLLSGEDMTPFRDLETAIKSRLADTGSGNGVFSEAGYGELIEMSCADADACYEAIEDLLLASPLAEGATAVLIYGDDDDAEQNEFPVGTPKA